MTDLLDDFDLLPHPAVDYSVPLDLDAIERDWSDGNFMDEMDAVRAAQRTIPRLIAELRAARNARPSPNGEHGYRTTCHGCGAEVTVKRRPIPGKRSWCAECVQNGEPAADRARRYRERKRQA